MAAGHFSQTHFLDNHFLDNHWIGGVAEETAPTSLNVCFMQIMPAIGATGKTYPSLTTTAYVAPSLSAELDANGG